MITIITILTIGIITLAFWAIYTREEKIKNLEDKVYNGDFWANNYSDLLFKAEEEIERLKQTIKDDTELISKLNNKLKKKPQPRNNKGQFK